MRLRPAICWRTVVYWIPAFAGITEGAKLELRELKGFTLQMINSSRHKGLKLLFERDDRRTVQAAHADKRERILARLEESGDVSHIALPGFSLHALKGVLAGFWSVSVSGNWRVIFRFDNGNALDVDLVDYH